MSEIKTFVFFDLETTGLPDEEFHKTKITEISLVACARSHLLETKRGDLPRVLHKLTLCVNPRRCIQYKSTAITGLDNLLLEPVKEFSTHTAELIKSFLYHLESPICLVAHNGANFDYPILYKQFSTLNVNMMDILCVDSIDIFKEIDEGLEAEPEEAPSTAEALEEFLNNDANLKQSQNETTPSARKTGSAQIHKRQRSSASPRAKRSLFMEPGATQYCKRQKHSFKLNDIHDRYYGYVPDTSHQSESDTINLLKCAVAVKEKFCSLAAIRAFKFESFNSAEAR